MQAIIGQEKLQGCRTTPESTLLVLPDKEHEDYGDYSSL
jgi:hypothetical protein